MTLCEFLKQAIEVGETVAPTTPTKVDDFVLLGMKILQSRKCPQDATYAVPGDDVPPQTVALAAAYADALEAAIGCEGDDCPCDDEA
jgi:hypothetical protein